MQTFCVVGLVLAPSSILSGCRVSKNKGALRKSPNAQSDEHQESSRTNFQQIHNTLFSNNFWWVLCMHSITTIVRLKKRTPLKPKQDVSVQNRRVLFAIHNLSKTIIILMEMWRPINNVYTKK